MQQEPSYFHRREPMGKTVLRMQQRPGATEPGGRVFSLTEIRALHEAFENILRIREEEGLSIHVPSTRPVHSNIIHAQRCVRPGCHNLMQVAVLFRRRFCSKQCSTFFHNEARRKSRWTTSPSGW